MLSPSLAKKLDRNLDSLLRSHQVTISHPRERMIQLDDVPVGAEFNKPMTNVLIRQDTPADRWQIYVDEDLRYLGVDSHRRRAFDGLQHRGWSRLASDRFLCGDVNEAIVWALTELESGLRSAAPQQLRIRFESAQDTILRHRHRPKSAKRTAQLDRRVALSLELGQLNTSSMQPTPSQVDCITAVAASLQRTASPHCPLLIGRSGVGKTTVARLAAAELLQRSLVSQVVEVRGAAVVAGPLFVSERDERLRETLEQVAQLDRPLVILDQFDLALAKSPVAASILSNSLDDGTKIIAVATAEFSFDLLDRFQQLQRRLEPFILSPPDQQELAEILRRHWREHALSAELELADGVLPLVNRYSLRRPGANPASGIGLLEAVLQRAAFSGQRCVGPDNVFHQLDHSNVS